MWMYVLGGVVTLVVVGVAVYPAFKVMPFAYGVSRVRAARGKMFSDADLQSLAGESYKDAIYTLEKRGLSDMLDLIDKDFREELVQKRLNKDYNDVLDKLTKYVPGRYRKFFQVIKERGTYDFIVAVIRSKTSPFYDKLILGELFLESELFSQSDLDQITSLSLDDFLTRLKGTQYHQIVAENVEEIKKGNLVPFEEAVNKANLRKLLSTAGTDPSLRRYTQLMIDIYNIRHGACYGDCSFIKGGRLSTHVLKEIEQATSTQEIVRALDKTEFGAYTRDVDQVIELEYALLKKQKDFGTHLLMKQPLSIDQILSFYIHKNIELRNIRILLKLIYARFEPETIRGLLV